VVAASPSAWKRETLYYSKKFVNYLFFTILSFSFSNFRKKNRTKFFAPESWFDPIFEFKAKFLFGIWYHYFKFLR